MLVHQRVNARYLLLPDGIDYDRLLANFQPVISSADFIVSAHCPKQPA